MANIQNTKLIWETFIELKKITKESSRFDSHKAKLLAYLKNNDNFKLVVGDKSWKAFVKNELSPLSLNSADRLAKIYQVYISDLGLKEQDIASMDSNVLYRLTTIVNKKNIKSWLDKAQKLTREDFYKLITLNL